MYRGIKLRNERSIGMKILIVEDDIFIADMIYRALTKVGYICERTYDGQSAADLIETNKYDLILLDIMLPVMDGYELIEYIKEFNTPVIFITARSRLEDKVKGLKIGADDYITKPFEVAELTARVESVLRRYHKCKEIIEIAGIKVDTVARTVTKNGENIELTMKELDLLLLFIRNRNIALFRDRIYEEVWGGDYSGESRTVDLHVQRLKKKLGLNDIIISVRKIGYRMETCEE